MYVLKQYNSNSIVPSRLIAMGTVKHCIDILLLQCGNAAKTRTVKQLYDLGVRIEPARSVKKGEKS